MDFSLHLTFSWVILIGTLLVLIGLPFFCGFAYRANFKNYIVGAAAAALSHLVYTQLVGLTGKVAALASFYESSRLVYMLAVYIVAAAVFGLLLWGGIRFLAERRFGFRQGFTIGAGYAGAYVFLTYGLQYKSNANTLSIYLAGSELAHGIEENQVEAFRENVVATFSKSPYLMLLDLAAVLYMTVIFIAIALLFANGIGSRNRLYSLLAVGTYFTVSYLFEVAATFSVFAVLVLGIVLAVGAVFVIRDQSAYEIYQ